MHTTSCSVPGVGNTPPDVEAEKENIRSVYMSSRYTYHSYRMSHDNKNMILHEGEGIFVRKGNQQEFYEMDLSMHNPREFIWHPDSRRVAFWAPHVVEDKIFRKRVAIMDVNSMNGDRPYTILYDPAKQWEKDDYVHNPYGMEWSPSGTSLYILERLYPKTPEEDEDGGTPGAPAVILRLDVSGSRVTKVTEIVRSPVAIDFFMPPVSRFENGNGASGKGYRIIYGAVDGLYLVDPKGRGKRRISALPAIGLYNVEWSPVADQIVLYFRRPVAGAGGKIFRGVWLAHLDRIGHEEELGEPFEQLYDRLDIHTLWYSPGGKYVTWSGEDEVCYRRPEDPVEKTVYLETADPETGEYLPIKGCAWHDNERYLAYTAGAKLFVHDAEKLETWEVMSFSDAPADFVAEPNWDGDRVILTHFEDATAEAAKKHDSAVFSHKR